MERVLAGLGHLGLFGLSRFLHRRKLLVLTYHSVVDVGQDVVQRCPFLYRNAVTATQFRKQLTFLRKRYTVVDSNDFREILSDRIAGPEYAALLTFDDGLSNNATVAAPILAESNTPAVFFLPTAFVDDSHEPRLHWTEALAARLFEDSRRYIPLISTRIPEVSPLNNSYDSILRDCITFLRTLPEADRNERLRPMDLSSVDAARYPADKHGSSILQTMTWDDVKQLPSCIELGSHSHSHASLANLPCENVQSELVVSKGRIEEVTGKPCRLFAYPYGSAIDVSKALYPLVEEAGYAAAFTQFPGLNSIGANPFALKRINVPGLPTLPMFHYHASGLHAWRKRNRSAD